MLATVQPLVPFVTRFGRRIIAEGERHLAIWFDHRAADSLACSLRRPQRVGQCRPPMTHRLVRWLAHGAPPDANRCYGETGSRHPPTALRSSPGLPFTAAGRGVLCPVHWKEL